MWTCVAMLGSLGGGGGEGEGGTLYVDLCRYAG